MTRVLFLKKGGRERTEVVSMQICSHTFLHCDDLAWDRGNPETSDRIFTWLLTGRGVARQEISWNGGTFLGGCENLRTPVITSVTSRNSWNGGKFLGGMSEGSKTDLEDCLY